MNGQCQDGTELLVTSCFLCAIVTVPVADYRHYDVTKRGYARVFKSR